MAFLVEAINHCKLHHNPCTRNDRKTQLLSLNLMKTSRRNKNEGSETDPLAINVKVNVGRKMVAGAKRIKFRLRDKVCVVNGL